MRVCIVIRCSKLVVGNEDGRTRAAVVKFRPRLSGGWPTRRRDCGLLLLRLRGDRLRAPHVEARLLEVTAVTDHEVVRAVGAEESDTRLVLEVDRPVEVGGCAEQVALLLGVAAGPDQNRQGARSRLGGQGDAVLGPDAFHGGVGKDLALLGSRRAVGGPLVDAEELKGREIRGLGRLVVVVMAWPPGWVRFGCPFTCEGAETPRASGAFAQ